MKCIDFDRKFADFTGKWVRENSAKYRDADEMEEHFPEVYIRWLNTPADWLAGKTPAEYFRQYDDAKMLVKWLRDYFKQGVSVPAQLLERITELKEQAPAELMILLSKPARDEDEAKMCALGLMKELESDAADALCIDWAASEDAHDDLAELAADMLMDKAQRYREELLAAYAAAGDNGRARLLDVLAYVHDEPRVFRLLMERFSTGDNMALYASYLLKYGSEEALPALERAISDPDTGYLDYIELRNAIEGLGGVVEGERDFTGDRDYEALRQLADAPESN